MKALITYYSDPFKGGYMSGDKETMSFGDIVHSWPDDGGRICNELSAVGHSQLTAKNWTRFFKKI